MRAAAAGMGGRHGAVASGAVPGSGRHASGGVVPRGFRRQARNRIRRSSRSGTCSGLLMYLSYTRRIPASATRRVTRP